MKWKEVVLFFYVAVTFAVLRIYFGGYTTILFFDYELKIFRWAGYKIE